MIIQASIALFVSLFFASISTIECMLGASLSQLQLQLRAFNSLTSPRSWFSTLPGWHRYVTRSKYLRIMKEPEDLTTKLTYEEYRKLLKEVSLMNYNKIHSILSPSKMLFNRGQPIVYAQKIIIATPATLYCWGDLHGDMHTLYHSLVYLRDKEKCLNDDFTVNNASTYLVFNGDYVDRGWRGAEVHALLCLLKIKNPDRVFIMRGNHEDWEVDSAYGFLLELYLKFFATEEPNQEEKREDFLAGKNATGLEIKRLLGEFYNMLPVVLFIGVKHGMRVNYLGFCHGGLEFHNTQDLLKSLKVFDYHIINNIRSEADRKKVESNSSVRAEVKKIFDNMRRARALNNALTSFTGNFLGFMWSDFAAQKAVSKWVDRRGMQFSNPLSDLVLGTLFESTHVSVVALFRAHQHNESMPALIGEQSPNRNVYKLPYMKKHLVFTAVATPTMGLPGRGFLKIKLEGSQPIASWKLTSIWGKCADRDPTRCEKWSESGNLTLNAWKNASDCEEEGCPVQ